MHEAKPEISVIVAAFNQEKYIGRCLRSLLHQTIDQSKYEIVVVNDGSTDRTSFALDLFSDNKRSVVKVVRHKRNLGLPSAINSGLRAATGNFVVRVDADDFVNTNFLNFLHYFLLTNQNIDAVACDYLLVDDKEAVLKRCNSVKDPIGCGIMFRREQLFDIGLYDETFLFNEEKELRIRFESRFKIQRLELPLYRYRRHGQNLTNDKEMMRRYDNKILMKHGKIK